MFVQNVENMRKIGLSYVVLFFLKKKTTIQKIRTGVPPRTLKLGYLAETKKIDFVASPHLSEALRIGQV